MIVSGHVLPWGIFGWTGEELRYEMVRTFLRNDTIAFVFISGFLFQHLRHKFEVRRYFLSKFKFVLLPYLVVCIPAILKIVLFEGGGPFADASTPVQILKIYYYGAAQQYLWYIPMITLVFLLGPILHGLSEKPGFFYCLPPLMALSLFIGRGPNPFHNAAYFLSIYLLGMWAGRHLDAFHFKFRRWLGPALGFCLVVYSVEVWLRVNRPDLPLALALSYLRWAVGCLVICWLFQKYEAALPKFLTPLASLSFGIFFVHGYFISALEQIAGRLGMTHAPRSLWAVGLGIVVVTVLASVSLLAVKKILGKRSRFVVGC